MLSSMKRGFTVIEVLITLIVMAILLTLGTITVQGSLAQGRDTERSEDIATIARGLETYYKRGNPFFVGSGTTKGSYPGSAMLSAIQGTTCVVAVMAPCSDTNRITDVLPGTTLSSFTPPNRSEIAFVNSWQQSEQKLDGTNTASLTDPVRLINNYMLNQLNEGKYVYKPMTSNGYHLCVDDRTVPGSAPCTRFALFYKKETTGEVVTVWSKHQ